MELKHSIQASCGWCSPDGKYFPCRYTQHSEKAQEICEEFNFEVIKPYGVSEYVRTLEKLNWAHVSEDDYSGDFKIFCDDWLNNAQIKTLYDIALAYGELSQERQTQFIEEIKSCQVPVTSKLTNPRGTGD